MTEKPNLGALYGVTADNPNFLGLQACPDLDQIAAPAALLGAPCATPYASVGAYCRNGPDALRRATGSLTANLDRHNFDLGGPAFPNLHLRPVDCGNLSFDESDSPGNRLHISGAVSKILARGSVPVLLGGDDSIPIPMLEAIGRN
jgi:agmatinase